MGKAKARAAGGFAGGSEAVRSLITWLPWLLLAGSLAIFLWEMRSVPPQADDAFISYRYARNLVQGQGLVYEMS